MYLDHMPEAGQGSLTTQLTALLKAILSQVDSPGLRLVYVTDDGYHPSDYYQSVLQRRCQTRAGPGALWSGYRLSIITTPVNTCSNWRMLFFGSGTEEPVSGQTDAGAIENQG